MECLVKDELKQASIGQTLVHAVHPRMSIPPIMFGTAIDCDHVFGSKWLLKILNRLGFCLSPDEVAKYKQSVVENEDINDVLHTLAAGSFSQWSADNVDHNVKTLDGKGSLHGMGIVISTTGGVSQGPLPQIPRQKRVKAGELVKNKSIQILDYLPSDQNSISNLKLQPLQELQSPVDHDYPDTYTDLLWHAKYFHRTDVPRPAWSGYMQDISKGTFPGQSVINMLPIIDLDPTNMTCIYSTLLFITEQATKLGIKTPVVTFDQPLWLKATEIITEKSMSIVLLLGGFHMLMSFMGSIGAIMDNSGLSTALETIYGSVSVKHMLTGKAIAMSLRGNFIVESTLMAQLLSIILPQQKASVINKPNEIQEVDLDMSVLATPFQDNTVDMSFNETSDDVVESSLQDNTVDMSFNDTSDDVVESLTIEDMENLEYLLDGVEKDFENGLQLLSQSSVFKKYTIIIKNLKDKLAAGSRTARLWIQYLDYIQVVKDFIRAERTGNWSLHLQSVSNMLNLFAATGHIHYAKSARLYLQQMLALEDQYPWVHAKFQEGYHTVRRSSRYWAGLWTDLIIEQVLMRSIKSRGGLTRGSGVHESVRTVWINTAHRCSAIHEALSKLTNTVHRTSEQHAELGASRLNRDIKDLEKVIEWFKENSPFDMRHQELRSLESGATATKEDNINCDDAESVGNKIQISLDNKNFGDVKIKRKDQARTLVCLKKSVEIEGESFHISPSTLFARLTLKVQDEDERAKYFKYPLTPEPASLFLDGKMRKANKHTLRNHLLKIDNGLTNPNCAVSVIDGGHLLYQTSWVNSSTYNDVAVGYLKYIKTYFKNEEIWVVFDGYSHKDSTKTDAHTRRDSGKRSANVIIQDGHMKLVGTKKDFLNNLNNKAQLISLLTEYLQTAGIKVHQSSGDADVLTCKTALDLAHAGRSVEVSGTDTDLLIILMHHWKEGLEIYFRTRRTDKKKTKTEGKVMWWSIEQLVSMQPAHKFILFAHIWTGCDYTSAIHNQGKLKILSSLRLEEVQHLAQQFNAVNAKQDEIGSAGIKIMKIMFGGKESESLTKLRHAKWEKAILLANDVDPANLPPSERAAHFHSLRVYLEMRRSETLKIDCGLNPCDWGWRRISNVLHPIMTDTPAAPESLLSSIRCNCKSSSPKQCGTLLCTCRKNGWPCGKACGACRGIDCKNPSVEYHERDFEDDGNIFSNLFSI